MARELNQELRVAALYYNNIDLDIASANDDVRLQTEQINRFVDKGVDLLIARTGLDLSRHRPCL